MNKKKLKQISAFIIIIFILFVFCLSIYFAIIGKGQAALAALGFNGFFTVILYFLLRLHHYITDKDQDIE